MIKINKELEELIPPLSSVEFDTLETSLFKEGIRDPLVVWNDTLVDGHNRYKIAKEYGLEFNTVSKEFDSIDDVKVWMIDNQQGRRNLTDGWKFELAQVKKELLLEKGKENLKTSTGGVNPRPLFETNKGGEQKTHNTQKEIATDLGWSSSNFINS